MIQVTVKNKQNKSIQFLNTVEINTRRTSERPKKQGRPRINWEKDVEDWMEIGTNSRRSADVRKSRQGNVRKQISEREEE